jgi:hypothetical protein
MPKFGQKGHKQNIATPKVKGFDNIFTHDGILCRGVLYTPLLKWGGGNFVKAGLNNHLSDSYLSIVKLFVY